MFEPDLAALGELDGVVDEVGQDLAEAQRIAEQMLGNARARRAPETRAPCRAPSARSAS